MRRVVVLALLALALPIAASAGTIDITNQFGSISISPSGITSAGSQLTSFDGVFAKNLGSVSFSTGVCLTGCNGSGIPGALATFSGAGSSFEIVCHQAICGGNGTVLFNGAFAGKITWAQTGFGGTEDFVLSGTIAGTLANGRFVTTTTEQSIYSTRAQLSQGVGHIRFGDTLTVPEPGTLGLLGTGLVGIAVASRRKFLRESASR